MKTEGGGSGNDLSSDSAALHHVGLYGGRVDTVSAEWERGTREIASLLVKLVIPAVIVNSFCVSFTVDRLRTILAATGVAAILLALSILLARLLFGSRPLDQFSAAFSNAGFMGLPLIRAVLGDEAVLYTVGFIALLNILQCTYGTRLIAGGKSRIRVGDMVRNPIVMGTVIGFALFVTGMGSRLPSVLRDSLQGISGMNTPLAMLVLGVYLAREKLRTLFTTPPLYKVCFARLLLIPLLTTAALWAMPVLPPMKLALMLVAAAPVGANVAVYAQLYDGDYAYASKSVVVSRILSPVSLSLLTAVNSVF